MNSASWLSTSCCEWGGAIEDRRSSSRRYAEEAAPNSCFVEGFDREGAGVLHSVFGPGEFWRGCRGDVELEINERGSGDDREMVCQQCLDVLGLLAFLMAAEIRHSQKPKKVKIAWKSLSNPSLQELGKLFLDMKIQNGVAEIRRLTQPADRTRRECAAMVAHH